MRTIQRKLPIGIQTFEKIREDNSVYIDKTGFLVKLVDSGKFYYLGRPSCFGKSLALSTLESMFSGKKELFKGLQAEEFMNRPNYYPSPVIRLDMLCVPTRGNTQMVSRALVSMTQVQAKIHGVEISKNATAGEMFDELIYKVYKKYGKVVILVDEFDTPYIEVYAKPALAEEIRDIMENFYIRIKANDEYIRFAFLAGITRLTRFKGLSTLDNVTDISMNEEYGEMCGFAETEIEPNFPEFIAETSENLEISPKELLEKMRAEYYGFCFDGVHRLYCPDTIVRLFGARDFFSFWIGSGATSMIGKYFKAHNLTVEQFRNLPVSRNFLDVPGNMDNTEPAGLMYQAGYLSVHKKDDESYELDYPNREVINVISLLLIQNIIPDENSHERFVIRYMMSAVAHNDADDIADAINHLLPYIPPEIFNSAGELNIQLNGLDMKIREWLYRSLILAVIRGGGIEVVAEMRTDLGRANMVVSHQGNTFVIELKVAYRPKDVPAKLAEALDRLTRQNYLAPYPGATGLAIVIDDKKQKVTSYKTVTQHSSNSAQS
jgi:hypothetical protein